MRFEALRAAPLFYTLLRHVAFADIVYYNATEYTEEHLGHRPFQSFVSRPDLHTPIVCLTHVSPPSAAHQRELDEPNQKHDHDVEDHSAFIMVPHGNNVLPHLGALILSPRDGTPFWISHHWDQMFNLQVQEYRGEPHLTFWHGSYVDGFGRGTGYILNQHYEIVQNVTTADDQVSPDLHEFNITPDGTALLSFQKKTLMQHNGQNIWVRDGCFQEVNIETGSLILEWCSSKFVPVADTYVAIDHGSSPNFVLDYFHLNSVDKHPITKDYLVSGRHTHTCYIISPQGDILWRIGGKHSDVQFLGDAGFSWQHSANFLIDKFGWHDTTISIFDNAWDRIAAPSRGRSRGVVLGIDRINETVQLLRSYESPADEVSGSQGSMQVLDNEDVVLGLGLLPHVAQYRPDGAMKLHLQIGFDAESYRTTRRQWIGLPRSPPVISVKPHPYSSRSVQVYASWNGATEVAKWRIVSIPQLSNIRKRPKAYTECPRTGFETVCAVSHRPEVKWLYAEALSSNGTVIGTSDFANRYTFNRIFRTNSQALEDNFRPSSDSDPSIMSHLFGSWYQAGKNAALLSERELKRVVHGTRPYRLRPYGPS